MHHVIIGAGPAGVVAAEHLRQYDPDARVTLLGDEPEPPYSRMAIPYYLVKQIGVEGTHLRKTADHFERLGIDIKRDRATAIDAQARRVRLASPPRPAPGGRRPRL